METKKTRMAKITNPMHVLTEVCRELPFQELKYIVEKLEKYPHYELELYKLELEK